MKKYLFLVVICFAVSALAGIPIEHTRFRKASIETVQSYADSGNAEAQLELAQRYYAGYQVAPDFHLAFQYMLLSAKQNFPESLYLLSRMYAEGIGTKADQGNEEFWLARAIAADPKNEKLLALYDQYMSDSVRAPHFLKTCADAGYLPALLHVQQAEALVFYNSGKFAEALPLFLNLAANGSAESAYSAGRIYADGKGNVEVDDIEAFVCFKQAAEDGYSLAQYELAVAYETGRGVEKNLEQSQLWYQKSAENGYVEAQFKYGEQAFRRAMAAESGADLNDKSDAKRGEYRTELKKAVRWYQAAAEQGHAESLYILGRLSASGEGVAGNPKGAVTYYERALAAGCAEAGFYLGLMYHSGIGVPRNLQHAIELYQVAADRGVTGALYYLANCYRFGEGVPQNKDRGENLYYKKLLEGYVCGQSDADVWILKAAREYGVIKWNSATSEDEISAAVDWVGIATQGYDEKARQIYADMSDQCRRNRNLLESRTKIFETQTSPNEEYSKKHRDLVLFPYVLSEVNVTSSGIIYARNGLGSMVGVNADEMAGLELKLKRPAKSKALGYSGVILAGMEFTNRETGDQYWSFVEYKDQWPLIDVPSVYDVVVSCDLSMLPKVKMTGWAVVYGSLESNGRNLDVFGSDGSYTQNLNELFLRNAFSFLLPSSVDAHAVGLDNAEVVDPSMELGVRLDPLNP